MTKKRTPAAGRFLQAIIITIFLASALISIVQALPSGPTFEFISESESPVQSSTQDTNSSHSGGKIIVANLNVTQQDSHWKAYVGNVSGRLVLENANNYSIFEWTITEVTGEVYATRGNSVNWTTVECANITHVDAEELAMNHTASYTPDDNITNTFSTANNHSSFFAGASTITQNSCNFTTQTFVNGSQQVGSTYFKEILLYDGTSIVYSTLMESDRYGYDTGSTYDYQILVAERGDPEFSGQSTNYYFYVELL
ncbi:MAG: hypothetical protein GXP63_01710 [DPANN group archaeon]|nr:hypothetical protein [DPANN group archaeon]